MELKDEKNRGKKSRQTVPSYACSCVSGFYFCPLSSLECDAGGLLDTWQEVAKENVMQIDDRKDCMIIQFLYWNVTRVG